MNPTPISIRVLGALRLGRPLRTHEIAEMLSVQPQAAQRALIALERSGVVERDKTLHWQPTPFWRAPCVDTTTSRSASPPPSRL